MDGALFALANRQKVLGGSLKQQCLFGYGASSSKMEEKSAMPVWPCRAATSRGRGDLRGSLEVFELSFFLSLLSSQSEISL